MGVGRVESLAEICAGKPDVRHASVVHHCLSISIREFTLPPRVQQSHVLHQFVTGVVLSANGKYAEVDEEG
jgi:hypothetical protein